LAAAVPLRPRPVTVTVLPVPTFALAKLATPPTQLTSSPVTTPVSVQPVSSPSPAPAARTRACTSATAA